MQTLLKLNVARLVLSTGAWMTRPKNRIQRDRLIGLTLTLLLHTVFFFGSTAALFSQARYGVETGLGGLEVNLVASPAESVATRPDPVRAEAEKLKPAVSGSSAGEDAATFSSAAGAIAEYKPGYLRNPAPRYPELCRRLGQEGAVRILADVSEKGIPVAVVLKSSSGYTLLDEAAFKAVKRWKFEPARAGAIPIASRVEIPIRFQLDERGV